MHATLLCILTQLPNNLFSPTILRAGVFPPGGARPNYSSFVSPTQLCTIKPVSLFKLRLNSLKGVLLRLSSKLDRFF